MQGIKNLGYGGAAAIDVQAGGETLNVAVWFDAAVNFSSGTQINKLFCAAIKFCLRYWFKATVGTFSFLWKKMTADVASLSQSEQN